jgi:hypothetical protein
MNQVMLQPGQIVLVTHPPILEYLKAFDFENRAVAGIANVRIEFAAFVQIDEVPVDGTPEMLPHDASITNVRGARTPMGTVAPRDWMNVACAVYFERPATAFLALPYGQHRNPLSTAGSCFME